MASGANEADIMQGLLAAGWQRSEILKIYLHVVNTALAAEAPLPEATTIAAAMLSAPVSAQLKHSVHSRWLHRLMRHTKWLVLSVVTVVAAIIVSAASHHNSPESNLMSPSNMAAAETATTAPISMTPVSAADLNNINPTTYLTTWNFSNLSPSQRSNYKATPLPNGTMKREYWLTVAVKTITLADGITFKAWAYDGQVPGPTLRVTEGDTVVIHFKNDTNMYHTIHFHGFHPGNDDGGMPGAYVKPNGSTTYTFTAAPAGLMLYHCHVEPIAEHINEGMYGTLIIDPKVDPRPKPAKDFIMMMNSFDITDPLGDDALKNGDGTNSIYSVNTVAFWYQQHPIDVKVGQLYRIYLVNITDFDPFNSFHLDGNFFTVTPTGTISSDESYTNNVSFGEGERATLDVRFQSAGDWKFSSATSGFMAKGFTGYFHATN
jgi:FtsP/CotA-like multicopper oxidase with cupredoxin domain